MIDRDTNELFYKIGITNQSDIMLRFTSHGDPSQIAPLEEFQGKERVAELGRRLSGHVYKPAYEIEVLHHVAFTTNERAAAAEAMLLKVVRSANAYRPLKVFSGHTECFLADAEQIQIVIEMMDLHAEGASDPD